MSSMSEKQWLWNGDEHPSYSELVDRVADLEQLVRDMWFKNIGRMDSCGWCVIGCDDAEHCELQERIAALGIYTEGGAE